MPRLFEKLQTGRSFRMWRSDAAFEAACWPLAMPARWSSSTWPSSGVPVASALEPAGP